jgi:ATP-dependent Clp protease ATP-binding subunit ClpA
MFERFTDKARAVVVGAQGHARELKHRRVGTEHVLLAILTTTPDGPTARTLRDVGVTAEIVREEIVRWVGVGNSPLGEADADALAAIGIDLDAVRAKVEESFGEGALDLPDADDIETSGSGLARRLLGGRKRPPMAGHIPFSPRNKKVLELSLREALRLKHNYIGTEHILLGMLREGEGLAVAILVERGIDLADLRRRAEGVARVS